MKINKRVTLALVGVLAISAIAAPQIKEVIKIVGVGAAVQRFGPDIDRAFNRLTKHEKTNEKWTKVVPILSIGINRSSSIGAVQVMGTRQQVEKVRAVAAPEAELFGREIRIRAMIPVSNEDVHKKIDTVPGVGVSGIVDLKL